ncbi:MAG: META domain-containing protein [bacterium]|nr:META domain-containing protein [bacterium]MCP4967573.1 META domain-containing protein [bacterium]
MNEQNWMRIGLLVLAGVGFLAILAVALTATDDIEGETWVAEELVIDGAMTAPISGTELTASFEDGSVNGIAGCNSFFASYEVDGSSVTVGPAGATMAFCATPEGIMEQETTYLTLISTADSFTREGDRLELMEGDNILISYRAAESEQD